MNSLVAQYRRWSDQLLSTYYNLSFRTKCLLWAVTAFNALVGLVFIFLGPKYVFGTMASYADEFAGLPFGWALLIILIIATSIPPILGYGTLITICGFAFGLQGWFYAFTGCVLGAAVSFLVCRRFLKTYYSDYLSSSPTFQGLSKAIEVKGLPLIILIRLCPISFPYSNLFFASLESTVSLAQFLLATLVITPKLTLHVWIGQRIYQLADPNSRSKMDSTTKIVNTLYIVGGSLLGILTGIYVYRLTLFYVRQVMLSEEDLEASHQLNHRSSSDSDEMTRDELDKALQAQGIQGDDDHNWGDNFSEFSEEHRDEDMEDDESTIRDREATPRLERRDFLT